MQLKAEHISFRYTDKLPWILNDISLEFQEGERAAIVGPSGYGKSTLAKILEGYEKASSGQVLLDGKPFPDKGFCPVQMVYYILIWYKKPPHHRLYHKICKITDSNIRCTFQSCGNADCSFRRTGTHGNNSQTDDQLRNADYQKSAFPPIYPDPR